MQGTWHDLFKALPKLPFSAGQMEKPRSINALGLFGLCMDGGLQFCGASFPAGKG